MKTLPSKEELIAEIGSLTNQDPSLSCIDNDDEFVSRALVCAFDAYALYSSGKMTLEEFDPIRPVLTGLVEMRAELAHELEKDNLPERSQGFKAFFLYSLDHYAASFRISASGQPSTTEPKRLHKPPGQLAWRIANFLLPEKTRVLAFDPALADFRHEYFEALKNERPRKATWMMIMFHLTLFQLAAAVLIDAVRYGESCGVLLREVIKLLVVLCPLSSTMVRGLG
ncbi:MAG: hypothetical protein R2834_02885 [Rhodothermales bacterium]